MSEIFKHVETKLIHTGEPKPRIMGAVSMPIFQSANYVHAYEANYHDIQYIRLNNTPNHLALHRKLAAIESGEAALVTSSGMAAISTALLTVLSAGDHLLAQECLYGGTHDLLTKYLETFGVSFDFIDGENPESWAEKLRPKTKAIYVETISNPLMQVANLEAVVLFAREHSLVSLVDNTFATPINFRPPEHGFDLSLHSCTKYLNGHSDIVGGAVIGRAGWVEKILHKLDHLGGSLDPHACFLLHRGLKTLALRVKCQNESGVKIAKFLESHPSVRKVNYPGLESNPCYERARRLFDGFGGMLSFEVKGGVKAAEKFIQSVAIPVNAPSLGGVETLLTRPASTSHLGMSPEDRRTLGISDSLIRLSVGIEAVEDLMEDLDMSLRKVNKFC
ncbi:MAG: aminotransferase class I/II-fold pyridoxal phosphate-dependent enzyme [Candidatus Aminicenantales bacterium]